MKKKILAVLTIVCCCVFVAGTCFAATYDPDEKGPFFQMGQFFKSGKSEEAKANGDIPILAKYNGSNITSIMVDYEKNIGALNIVAKEQTDLDIVNSIAKNIMLYEEAVRLGFSATEAEVEALIENAKLAYTIPEGKKIADDFCKGAGITFEEYLDIYRKQLPQSIARQKLIDAVGKKYCETNGLKFTKVNPPKEMLDAQEAYKCELFDKYRDKIEYFIADAEMS